MTPPDHRASLVGHTFGELTVVRDHVVGGIRRPVWVRCSCGVEQSVFVHNLMRKARQCRQHVRRMRAAEGEGAGV